VLDTLARYERDVVLLEQIRPSSVHPAEPLIRHQPRQRFVVGHQREGSSVQVDPEMLNCPDGSKALSLVAAVILLSSIAATGGIRDHIFAALVVSLNENGAQPNGTPVSMELKRAAVIRPPEDRGLGQLDLQLLKGLLAGLVPVPRGAKLEQPVQRGTNVGALLNELPIVVHGAQKGSELGHALRGWHVDNRVHLGLLRGRSIGDDLMTEVRYARHGKLHFLGVQLHPFFADPRKGGPQMCEVLLKGLAINDNVINIASGEITARP
jgi:hypothetical protein